jgi:hypothetical protein
MIDAKLTTPQNEWTTEKQFDLTGRSSMTATGTIAKQMANFPVDHHANSGIAIGFILVENVDQYMYENMSYCIRFNLIKIENYLLSNCPLDHHGNNIISICFILAVNVDRYEDTPY